MRLQTGDDVLHVTSFHPERSSILANYLRLICHVLIEYLPDDEIPDIEADLLDKSSIYVALDREGIPRRLEQGNSLRKRRGTFGPVVAGKP